MEEFLVELLLGLAELVFEALVEFAATALVDGAWRFASSLVKIPEISNPTVAYFAYGLLGLFFGGVTVLFFPHPLMHPSRIHGISLLISPVIAGLGMSLLGSVLRNRAKRVVRIESFGYGFAFAFGMAFVRLVLTR